MKIVIQSEAKNLESIQALCYRDPSFGRLDDTLCKLIYNKKGLKNSAPSYYIISIPAFAQSSKPTSFSLYF